MLHKISNYQPLKMRHEPSAKFGGGQPENYVKQLRTVSDLLVGMGGSGE